MAVPLFFIISGALFFRNYTPELYGKKLGNRVKTLLVPYLCWNTINMLMNAVISYTPLSNFVLARAPFEFTAQNVILGIFYYKYNPPFWFIFCLFIYVVLSPGIDFLLRNKYIGIIIILIVIILYYKGIMLPEAVFFAPVSIIYYLIGAYVGKHWSCWFQHKANTRELLICSGGILLAWLYFLNTYFQVVPYSQFVDRLSVFIIIEFAFSVWFIFDGISELIPERAFFQHSFWIYAMHQNVAAVITKLFYFVFPKNYYLMFPNFIVTTCFTLVIIELIYLAVRKICPKVHVVLSGDRA